MIAFTASIEIGNFLIRNYIQILSDLVKNTTHLFVLVNHPVKAIL